jgi:aspartyl-tRNA(Asn)/glutamyl-tRNA(Gln) amidotransferase subunit C
MSVSREDIERVARLAALRVDEDALPTITEQIGRILEYVSQLSSLMETTAPSELASPVWLGADRPQAPRPDDVEAADLHRALSELAPVIRDNLILVPKLAAMEDE